jgi:hypothetical protein
MDYLKRTMRYLTTINPQNAIPYLRRVILAQEAVLEVVEVVGVVGQALHVIVTELRALEEHLPRLLSRLRGLRRLLSSIDFPPFIR